MKLSGERAFLERLLGHEAKEECLVIDVGAHHGAYTRLVLDINPDAFVHAFEPNPSAFEILAKRFASNKAVCHNLALGPSEGVAALYDYERDPGSSHASLVPSVIEQIHGSNSSSVSVPMTSLTSFLLEKGIHAIDLIKIDVEGSEVGVLQGLVPFLSDDSNYVRAIQIEFNEMNVLSRTFVADLMALLPRYRVSRLLSDGSVIDIGTERPLLREVFAYQNLVFTRDSD